MANVKFTEFPSAATVGSTDIIPIVQGGTNKKATAAVFSTYIGSAFVALTGNQTIAGVKTFSSQLASSVATGTAPFSIASTTKVTNLNADLLDGYTSADFQLALTNPITGTGTTNYLPKFTGTSALGNSLIYDNGTNVGVGTTSPTRTLSVNGQIGLSDDLISTNSTNVARFGYNAYYSSSGFNLTTENSIPLTFGTASAERMRITSAGLVGIGTTAPGYKFSIEGTAANIFITQNTSSTSFNRSYFFNNNGIGTQFLNFGSAYAFGTEFGVGQNGSVLQSNTTSAFAIGTSTATPLYLGTNGAERMRIFSDGNIAINSTTNAGYKLDVNGTARVSGNVTISSGNEVRYYRGDNAIYTRLYDVGGSSGFVLNNMNSDGFSFQNGGVTKLRIDSSGAATFNSGTANQNTKIFGDKVGMSRTSDGAEVVYFSKNTDLGTEGTANINGYNGIQFRTQGAESVKVTIKENGNLLVNKTTDVGYKLDVFGTTRLDPQSGEYGLVVGRASGMVNIRAGSDDGGYLLMDSAGEGGMVGLNWYSSENVILANGGGKVGIGTTSPADKLDIYSSANSQQGLKITNPNAGTSAIAVTKYSNGTYTHLFGILGTNYTTYGVLQANEAFMYSAAQSMSFGADGDSSIKFGTGTGVIERMRITSSGQLAVNTTSPDTSALVQIDSNTQGFLVPRMLESEINSISSPAAGLLVYNTNQNHMCMYDGSVWKKFSMSNM